MYKSTYVNLLQRLVWRTLIGQCHQVIWGTDSEVTQWKLNAHCVIEREYPCNSEENMLVDCSVDVDTNVHNAKLGSENKLEWYHFSVIMFRITSKSDGKKRNVKLKWYS